MVRPSVVSVMQSATPKGIAVCVDKRGYFLAHRSTVGFPTVFGRLSTGIQIELREIAFDEPTQLVLLQSPTLGPVAGVPAIRLGSEPEKAGGTLLAAFLSGPVRSEYVSGERYGVVRPSLRLMPLNEVRFEAPASQVGGGLLFTTDGALIGVLGATLGTGEPARYENNQKALGDTQSRGGAAGSPPGGFGGGGARPANIAPRLSSPIVQFGPAPQTVAYSVSSSVLQRVVAGLLSPSHKVVHPAIGVYCRDAIPSGAEVAAIQAGSPADKAGLKPGDVILKIGTADVRNQIDVARITMNLRIGSAVELTFRREGQEKTILVSVGAS